MLTALYNNMCYVMTCYIAAWCYVNCVLGYAHICYVNLLHVLSCTFLHDKQQQHLNNNRHTGYPALDSTGNIYFSGSGWEIMYLCLFCLLLCFLFEAVYVCLFMLLYVFFDCKCKHLNRLGENIQTKQTGHPLAHHSTANKYLSRSGWMSCICVLLFSKVFLVFVFTRVFVAYTCKHSKRLGKTRKQQEQQQQTTHLWEKQNKYSSSSRNLRDIYSRSSGGLEDVLYFWRVCCSRRCLFLFLFL